MAFFRQLKLLLWKNGLAVIRQPLWSLTLITWPLIIFIIIAVTRNQFPPVIKDTCYAGPRNLPSAGFFPFLETLMCNTDSTCYNKSRLVDPTATKSHTRSARDTRSNQVPKSSLLADLFQGTGFFNFPLPNDSRNDPAALVEAFNNIFGSSFQGSSNVSLMNALNTSLLGDQETINKMLESVNLLKRAICTMTLPMMNTTSPNPLCYAVVTFCKSNNTVFEVSLSTLNQILKELMLEKPDRMMTVAEAVVAAFNQLQNQTSLWESLLAIPQLSSSGSVDQVLDTTEALLTNIQGAMHVIQSNFPEASASLSNMHPLLAGGINMIHYAQNWPGKDVSITLGEVVTLPNNSLSEMVTVVLQEVKIPLHKAIGLTLDRDMVHLYLCNKSSNQLWLKAACGTGTVDMLLGWISPDKVAKQALLVWSKQVAPSDVSFAKGLLHSLMGGSSPGGQGGSNFTRTRRSVDTPPQNIDEELFLGVGQVVMEIIKMVPELDMAVQSVLRTGFQSMKSATVALDTVEGMMTNVLKDADQLQMTYLTLLTNQSGASVWTSHVLDSVMEVITKVLSTESLTCEGLLGPFEWLLNTESIKIEVWRSVVCQNSSALQQAILMEWLPLVQKAQDVYTALTSQEDYNVTLPMILSEWHKLYNNSVQVAGLSHSLAKELGGEYWMNWMPDNSSQDVTEALQQSVSLFMVNFGEKIEKSQLWPEVKNYFHMVFWILNYRPDVTTQPANCSININNSAIHCDTGLEWPQFVQVMTQALMSPNQNFLVNCLKGSVHLLQHVLSDTYKYMAASFLKQEIKGGDALSAYLINLLQYLDGFVKNISMLPDQNISNPDVMIPLIGNLLQSAGLKPLLPLLLGNGPLNVSSVLDVALQIGRLNQGISTFNETEPTMLELEKLIIQFLSIEGNLTMSLSHIMGQTLLNYSVYLHPDGVARLREVIQPFTNQTSTGVVEAILSAMELLKTVMDSPNGDPTNIILGYIQQLQEFVMSLYRLRRIQPFLLPSGQLSTAQITDLHLLSKDFLNLLTPESLQNLSQAGPDAAQNIVAQKLVAFLPPEVQQEAAHFLQDFKAFQHEMTECTAGQNCLAGVSEIFTFLEQILDMTLSANGNVSISISSTSSVLKGQESEKMLSMFFPLLLSSNDKANVKTFNQTLHFIRLILATPNVTVSDVQNALQQSNLTLAELNNLTALAGAANINDLMVNIMEIINSRQCFEPQHNQMVTAQCVFGLINGVSNFLTHLPALRNETAILSLIPLIINNTFSEVSQVNFSSNASMAVSHTLNSILANIKMNLQLNHLYTPEIMNEIRVVEGLIQLVASTEPFNNLNTSLLMDPMYAQKVYLKIVEWYLKRLENITSTSAVSELLHPFYYLTQMQVTLQLAQVDFSVFISEQVETLMNNLQYPIDGAGVSKIGQTTVEIIRHLFEFMKVTLEAQNNIPGSEPFFNTTILQVTELQVEQYLDLIQNWIKQPNVPSVLSSMFQWGDPSINVSAPVTDLQQLLETTVNFLSKDQQAYISILTNITMSLSKALMVAEQPGGLASGHFLAIILEAVQSAMQIPTAAMGPLPLFVQQNILEIVQDSLKLIVQPDTSFPSSLNISLLILKRAESVIQQTLPDMFAAYLLSGLKVATTYVESISAAGGPDSWNQLILDEMKTVQSLLPSNSTAQSYVSILINITHFILESGQGNMSLWEGFQSASVENLPIIFGQMGKLLDMLWPLVMEDPDSQITAPSLEAFANLAPVLEQVMTGKADQDTWDKLEKILEALLSVLKGTELLDSDPSAVTLFENIIGSIVKNIQAQNVMILSLQMPVATLMREIAQSVNTSHFNLSEFLEGMQLAIERTVQAAEQANGTLECREVLKEWEPVREAVGLSYATMDMWCNISLQPVLEAFAAAQTVSAHMNMSHIGVGPLTVSTTAARIVMAVESLYQVNINSTLATEQLSSSYFSQLSLLAGQPLSPEAQLYWYKQLQDVQWQNSLSSFKNLSNELVSVAPFIQPYIEAIEETLSHILKNYHLIQVNNSSRDLFGEAAMIFLSSANIKSNNIYSMMEGFFSGLNETSLTDMMREAVKVVIDMNLFENEPMVSQALEQFLASNDSSIIVQKVAKMSAWMASTQASGLDLMAQALPKIYDILRPLLSVLTQMSMDMPANMELFEDPIGNIIAILKQIVSTSGLLTPMDYHPSVFQPEMPGGNHTTRVRNRREALLTPARDPMDDFIDMFYIDYPAMFKAISVPATTTEIMETVNVFFANPDLRVVVKGATSNMPWGLNNSREETIDAALGALSFFTLPGTFQMESMDLLTNAVDMLPDGFPFSSVLKNVTRALAGESEENLMLMQEIIQTAAELLQINLTDPQFTEHFGHLRFKVCTLEKTESVRLLMSALSVEPGQLCNTILPSLQMLVETLMMNGTSLPDAIFQTVIGEPKTFDVHSEWSSVLSQSLGFNISMLSSFNINITSPGVVTVGEMLRNKTAFLVDVQHHMHFDPAALLLLMNTTLPNNNLEILSWFVNLRHCSSKEAMTMKETDDVIFNTFCSLSAEQWYSFSLLMARHLNMEKVIYRMVLPEEIQSLVGVLLNMAESLTNMMNMVLPAVSQLQTYMLSVQDRNLVANNEFNEMVRGQRASISTKATFVTLSRALCSKGMLALLGISKLPVMPESNASFPNHRQREEMIERFKIPRNASPFCMDMYLDMVNTTGGAIAWAFLKPMLMGQILYTPDTPVTRAIMEKANATLQEFANLGKYSKDWITSSNYVVKSAQILSNTLPMLQNSLSNSFVVSFIEMQTDINVGTLKETLSNFSNMTVMLANNKHVLDQITILSTLMVNLSSCIKFDRYRGYDSADELNTAAQDLAKNRDLYASVIFKLPKDKDSSKNRQARSSSSTFSLPPKVSYTIRMHMDNVMRTDKVRDAYFMKDNYISGGRRMRYNRGFIYLQENIDRAIIETQTGQRIMEPAVQLQPFPYPCHPRDEYLEAISFVFPIMMMIAWVLFVADFVKKLVHERELRLHEYMKMMGVNPLSHFFAWFLECAAYLVVTIFILTLVLKYGGILPNSDGFILFLYLCDYGLSILSFSYLVSSFFDKTYIAGLSGSLLYILCFFPFIVVVALETNLSFSQKSALSLFSPTCFSYASQYISRYESQGEGIHWSNSYISPIAGDTASFGWLCWLMLIDSILYFLIGGYIRMVFPGNYGISSPWYFLFKGSFWADLCCCVKSNIKMGRGLLFTNIMQKNQPVFTDDKGKGQSTLSSQAGEDFSNLPVGVALHGLSKLYGDRVAIQNLNLSFYEGQITSLLGHNGAGKTTTMSLLTGLFSPSSGTIEVYGRDMQTNIEDVRKELGVCMQYDVLFDHMTTKEHLLLYGQIKAPHWSYRELLEQVRTILEETGMYSHRHKRVGNLSGGMKRKLSISIAFIGGSRLVVLDEPTTGVDPCSRRNIWDIVTQHKKQRTVIMSTHHLDEAEVLSDRIAFLERGGLKCCGSPFHLKDKLGQGYKLTLTKKMQNLESERIDNAELKAFIQAHVPEARLKDAQGGDLVYLLPPFTSSNTSSYRSLLTALDSNLDALQLGGYGISDTTLEEVFLHLTDREAGAEDGLLSISETVSDTDSIDSFPSDSNGSISSFDDKIKLTGSSVVSGMALAWQQMAAILIKRFHHSRRDWKGLIAQILLPVLFMVFAMGLGSIRSDLRHYPELELSPALYNLGPSYSFFSNQNPNSAQLMDTMLSFPGIDNACLDKFDNAVCTTRTNNWSSSGNSSKAFSVCKCTSKEQICDGDTYQPPHKMIPSSQIVYNLSGINVENYLVATANDFIRNRYGGFDFGMPLPSDFKMGLTEVPKNRTLSKVWYNPEGQHTMPAYLNSLNNLILRSNLAADKDPRKYAISVTSHPYFGRADDEDAVVQGILHILVAMCVLTGYSITTASFAIYEVSEHHSGSKRLQHISGISEPFYWAVNFFYDMVMYLIPVTLTVGVIAAFQIPAFTERQNLGAVALLLVLFGFATFPWMYLLSGVFKNAEMAFIAYVCINLFISINTIMSTSTLHFLGEISMRNSEIVKEMFSRLSNAFLIFPQFNFGNGLMKLARMNVEVQLLSGYGIDAYQNPFSTNALGWMFISSFIQGMVFFTLRLLLNRFLIRKVRNLICGRKTVPLVACEEQDVDVATEQQRVASGEASTDILQVNQLTKVYQHLKKKVTAVKSLSLGIPAGECFGLLGVNGAGKTTTFKMLTGDVSPTDGTAQIRDWDGRLVDIMECRNEGINIGYCPQVDALDNLLTGKEHLYFYARIRGISKKEIDGVVTHLLKRLQLSYHKDIITDGYSCGTRRKLSTALALVGHPQILLLDEPSSGMDPRTKRHLWKIISDEVKGKCAVVLTSHSMEECEALCSRLAIMVKGQFRCLGSLQHIKNRFGSGFTVKMYLAEASCESEAITGFMRRQFPTTYLKDQHSSMVEYHVPIAPGGVADIFDQLESNKKALQIKHFSVSQTTLDEVFINFAMDKIGMESISLDSEDECDDLDSIKAAET
ncbi:ATP-binding cassette sub-family A member 12 isoform X2 [Etheostoma spectabile]|uniref:ATP-binding cassette sub-family A member 12 isoform X2 n=1 Tax=Etheostoma spectabile TaxID=54343 RepID=UPI0013AF2F1A|nr:ATP-binding cassette sub-family A member 12 isoform X2 [Etheostoma spectabile]